MTSPSNSFGALLAPHCHTLILGSLPGVASLAAKQYYAHRSNAFWPIMQRLYGVHHDAPYSSRVEQLLAAGVGLWDVIQSAPRTGSLDSDIELADAVYNDVAGLLEQYPSIRNIGTNGGMATKLFMRDAWPKVLQRGIAVSTHALPSTSPANARMTLDQKHEVWKVPLGDVLRYSDSLNATLNSCDL